MEAGCSDESLTGSSSMSLDEVDQSVGWWVVWGDGRVSLEVAVYHLRQLLTKLHSVTHTQQYVASHSNNSSKHKQLFLHCWCSGLYQRPSSEKEAGTRSSGSWHDENLHLTCQEPGRMRDWVDSCLHRDSWIVINPCEKKKKEEELVYLVLQHQLDYAQ